MIVCSFAKSLDGCFCPLAPLTIAIARPMYAMDSRVCAETHDGIEPFERVKSASESGSTEESDPCTRNAVNCDRQTI